MEDNEIHAVNEGGHKRYQNITRVRRPWATSPANAKGQTHRRDLKVLGGGPRRGGGNKGGDDGELHFG